MSTAMLRRSSNLFLPISLFLFAVLAPPARPMSFNLTGLPVLQDIFCGSQKAICLQGNATSASGILLLTASQVDSSFRASVGRAYYSERVRLWDRSTGEATNFTTNFSIAISLVGNNTQKMMGDGLAFFLASNSSEIPRESNGGLLGLMSSRDKYNASGIVAVEFDSYANVDSWDGWDPGYLHVGIDVNSIKSVRTAGLYPRFYKGDISGDAKVSYDATTQNLSVLFFNQSGVISVSHTVDLRKILSEWVVVGFAATTGMNFELNRVRSWQFESTLDVLLEERNKNQPEKEEKKKRATSTVGLLVGLSVVAGVIVVVVSLVLFCVCCRKNKRGARGSVVVETGGEFTQIQDTIGEDLDNERGPRRFPYRELSAATNNFSDDRKLGAGGFGAVYKGFLSNPDAHVAIKRLSKDSKQGTKEYVSEVKIISKLRHKNLVPLVGWCHELSDLLLVYEFMANGCLDDHLFDHDKLLSWPTRYSITLGLASALLYLHTEWEQCVVHRDIKSSNVLLDNEFNARLGDFGLARLIDHGSGMKTTFVAGTLGYMAPECYMTGKGSKESDVYSFGIVLLETACGRRAIDSSAEQEKVQLLNWVWGLYGSGKVLQAADERLGGTFDHAQMERVIVVGLWCANPDLNARPSMRQALAALSFEAAAMPNLPQKMPMPVYYSPPMTAAVGELLEQPATTSSSPYSTIPYNSTSGTDYSSTLSSKSASSSTGLVA